jgi:hypothetical protein
MSDGQAGVVYLLHFHRPYKHARHYLGFSEHLGKRLAAHRLGNGARLMEVIAGAGIGWTLARTWVGDRALERRLKARKESPRLCPICRGEQGPADRIARACGTETLLRACAEPRTTRDSLARTYALAICSSEPMDWDAVNRAIRERWSASALDYIQRRAWKRIEEQAAEDRGSLT